MRPDPKIRSELRETLRKAPGIFRLSSICKRTKSKMETQGVAASVSKFVPVAFLPSRAGLVFPQIFEDVALSVKRAVFIPVFIQERSTKLFHGFSLLRAVAAIRLIAV